MIKNVKKEGMNVGLAFNPHTEIPENLIEWLPELDLVLLMTV